jgi:glycosyltransferase A (GT-A) superfamily protein (DUF2064 family)
VTTIVLIAKEPLPGRAKTRLHPPLSLEQAAKLAAASIDDTIGTLLATPASKLVLLWDGGELPFGSESFEVVPQTAGTLDERLAAIFDSSEGPTVLVGMDTPQLSLDDLAPVFEPWPADCWFGPANDGGFWAIGMKEPDGSLIRGVPMSREDTGALQWQRLADAGLTTAMLPRLTDVDTIRDAREVAALAPDTRFARTLARFTRSASLAAQASTGVAA